MINSLLTGISWFVQKILYIALMILLVGATVFLSVSVLLASSGWIWGIMTLIPVIYIGSIFKERLDVYFRNDVY